MLRFNTQYVLQPFQHITGDFPNIPIETKPLKEQAVWDVLKSPVISYICVEKV